MGKKMARAAVRRGSHQAVPPTPNHTKKKLAVKDNPLY